MVALPTSDWRDRPWSRGEMEAVAPAAADWCLAGSVEHVFTHFSLTLDVYVGTAEIAGAEWRAASDAGTGLPSVFLKALQRGLA
jgi:A/G-specific adenine glycosylase